MTDLPKITIAIPTFNQGKFIEETICSIIDQDYPSVEIIIMDGGSTDNTTSILKKYNDKINYWESCEDKGQTHAINKAFFRSTGEVFNWLNSDDKLEKGALHIIGSKFRSDKNLNLLIGRTRFFDAEKTVAFSGRVVFTLPESTFGYGQINQPAMYYRRSSIQSFFPLDESLRYCMDLELWYRYLLKWEHEGIAETNQLIAAFRLHPDSKTLEGVEPFKKEKDLLYFNLASTHTEMHRKSLPYFNLWNADELMLRKSHKKSQELLRKVPFWGLCQEGKRRYLGVLRRNLFKS